MTSIDPWLLSGVAITLIGALSLGLVDNVRIERRIYWLSWLVGGAVMMVGLLLQRGWSSAVVAYAVMVVGVTFAYFRTSYLKVGGRIFSFWIARTQPDPLPDGSPGPPVIPPPDSYRGIVTAAAQWWLMAVVSVCAAVGAVVLGMSGPTLGIAVFAVVLLAGTGYIDQHDGFPIARGQWVQAALIVVVSIPIFLLPPLAYAIGYYIDRPRRRAHEWRNDK
ncbi:MULTISPECIES: hypothetical protein [Mycobacteriaceae]|uniref:Uncharacterized protein n=1 Tax=Mycolicibacterium neoaurum VKM Ac-1815D TaxID=700508 RepID=V5XAJ2_MYCNE|nr:MULTISPECIES: hypothetical protein [Mycobacteriaceae]AHC24853.1 hypothetical protein D174_09815 [Mycolicibacterium neoaurum VKM Ac-1815D]AMO05399.1 hypothetical protein MyAD_09620 [Mycolicibacterium neoaurum]AXK76284.1 hypothetical protein DXK33_15425 [Mycolicibacterium neoaurum]KJQ50757.1 hypothetical protein TS71_09150 [Mycolicibacterium neoaurum]KUM09946.1 hypothetical protein AVZ31_03670 [Mycolicibacterium neoaurum]